MRFRARLQAIGHLQRVVERFPDRQLTVDERSPQRLTVEQLGDDVRPIGGADFVNGEDVRMIQRGDRAGFLLEATEAIGVGGERRGQDLDGDVAAEARVPRA